MKAPFQIIDASTVLRIADGAAIPADPANRDYQQYQAWLTAGGIPDPADAPASFVTENVTPNQLARALINAGTLTLDQITAEPKD